MVSNALSVKSFDTKTPVICKPPPWPPALPPPPIATATFFCFAGIVIDEPTFPPTFAAATKLTRVIVPLGWYGKSSDDPTIPYIVVKLWNFITLPSYKIEVTWKLEGKNSPGQTWFNQKFSDERPYVGEQISFIDTPTGREYYAVVHEVPS